MYLNLEFKQMRIIILNCTTIIVKCTTFVKFAHRKAQFLRRLVAQALTYLSNFPHPNILEFLIDFN